MGSVVTSGRAPAGQQRTSRGPRRRRFRARRVAVAVLVAVALWFGAAFVDVWRMSQVDDAAGAQAIVVLGAAQYAGRPSPVFAARLDHAADLYAAGVAGVVVVTGGRQEGDTFSEASSADLYLQERGVAPGALRLEVHSRTSFESLLATSRILADERIDEVVLVSDPWHSARVADIARRVGLVPHLSPTPTSRYSAVGALRQMARETVGVAVGRLVGYGRLDRWTRS